MIRFMPDGAIVIKLHAGEVATTWTELEAIARLVEVHKCAQRRSCPQCEYVPSDDEYYDRFYTGQGD